MIVKIACRWPKLKGLYNKPNLCSNRMRLIKLVDAPTESIFPVITSNEFAVSPKYFAEKNPVIFSLSQKSNIGMLFGYIRDKL